MTEPDFLKKNSFFRFAVKSIMSKYNFFKLLAFCRPEIPSIFINFKLGTGFIIRTTHGMNFDALKIFNFVCIKFLRVFFEKLVKLSTV